MSIHKLPEITAEQENFRLEPLAAGLGFNAQMVKRDPVEPVPIGTYVAMVFQVTGYDEDCDGSLMARFNQVSRDGLPTGWEPNSIGLYEDTDVVLDGPGDLHALIEDE